MDGTAALSKLTPKQERFCLNLFEGLSQREAYLKAGYSSNMLPATLDQNACRLAANSNVVARLAELRSKAESDKVMTVTERKERLSEIARANLTDFMELGKDGSWVNLGPETKRAGAIQEIHSRTEYDKDSDAPTVYTSVKLHDPIRAISELNKMEKVYETPPTGAVQILNSFIFVLPDGTKLTPKQLAVVPELTQGT